MVRLVEEYNKRIKGELMSELGLKNPMQAPTLKKIVVNVGAGEAVDNSSAMEEIVNILTQIDRKSTRLNSSH